MRILIICDLFYPSKRSVSLLIQKLTLELLTRKNSVTIFTTSGLNNDKEEIFGKFQNLEIFRFSLFNLHGDNYIFRVVGQLLSLVFFIILLIFKKKKIEKIFIYSPPLFYGLIFLFFKKQIKILNLQDFFPQNAIDLKIIKNTLIINFLKKIEKIIYLNSDFIFVHSNNAKNYLKKKFPILKNKIFFQYNWEQFNKITYKKKKNKKFIFIFGGSIGPSQNLEMLIKPFKELWGVAELHIYGEGLHLQYIKKKINDLNIKNIKIFSYLSENEFANRVRNADSAIVTLSIKNTTPIIPGKFNFYCSNAKNITSIVNKESDIHKITKKYKLGYSTDSEDSKRVKRLLSAVIKKRSKLLLADKNAYIFAKKNFDAQDLAIKLEKI
jgi:colanic acid biosynthesis glycosyl transferase WcaI